MKNSSAKLLQLGRRQRGRILRHFLALSESDRILRFGNAINDTAIAHYVDQIDMQQDVLFGLALPHGQLLAVAHLAVRHPVQIDAPQYAAPARAELGLSVLARARGKGYGSRLFELVIDHCRGAEIASLYMHCLSSNQTMLHIAKKAGMAIVRDHGEADAYLQFPSTSMSTMERPQAPQQAIFAD